MLVGKNMVFLYFLLVSRMDEGDTKMIGTIGFGHTLWRQSAQPHTPLHVRGN